MKRKNESDLTDQAIPVKKKKVDHKDLIGLMQENKTTEIIERINDSLIDDSQKVKAELKNSIIFAQYSPKPPIISLIKQMNLLNYAIYHGSTELLDKLVKNNLIQSTWLPGKGLIFKHALTLTIILNNRNFLNHFLAKIFISSEERLQSFMEAIKFNNTRPAVLQEFPHLSNPKSDYINDGIQGILNLYPLPDSFSDLNIGQSLNNEQDIYWIKKNFANVSNFHNNLFLMFKAYQFDADSTSSKLNKDAFREIHKIGF